MVNLKATSNESMLKLGYWNARLPKLKEQYQAAGPFPNVVMDDFLELRDARKAMAAFPKVEDEGWIHYLHYNEKKHGLNKMELLPAFIQTLIRQLNSPEFVSFLSALTGIPDLRADDSLEGGGLHQTQRGGFLNIHADFTVHPHKRNWRRRVNLLLYLNEDWKEEYKGALELWTRDMSRCEKQIYPFLNRCVVFNTDEDSYHGLPTPIECPEEASRKSIALYYFTEEEHTPKIKATNYRARPNDGIKGLFIYLDKKALSIYNFLKSKLGLSDDFVSRILNLFNRRKR